jgi:enoyl-CoA hydratase
MADILRIDDDVDGIRVLTLNRPERLNALNGDLVNAVRDAVRDCQETDKRVILIRGEGRAFCAGADLKWLASGVLADHGAHQRFQDDIAAMCTGLEAAPQVTIAAVDGYALAGGLELVLSCDLVVAAADAELGDEHIKRNLLPGGGGSQRLPRKIGVPRALFHLLTGRRITGAQAAEYGLACLAAPPGAAAETALEVAKEIAAHDPQALAHMKEMVRRGMELPLADGLWLERFLQSRYRGLSTAMDSGVAEFAGAGGKTPS